MGSGNSGSGGDTVNSVAANNCLPGQEGICSRAMDVKMQQCWKVRCFDLVQIHHCGWQKAGFRLLNIFREDNITKT